MGIFKTIKYIIIFLSVAIALSPFVILYQIFFTDFPFPNDINPFIIVLVGLVICTLPVSAIWVFLIKRKLKKRRSFDSNNNIGSIGEYSNISGNQKAVKLWGGQILAVVENTNEIVYNFKETFEKNIKEINNGAWLNFGLLAGYMKDLKNLVFTMDGKPMKVSMIDYKIRKDKNGKWYLTR